MGDEVVCLKAEILKKEIIEPGLDWYDLRPLPRQGSSYLWGVVGDAQSVREYSSKEINGGVPEGQWPRLAYLDKVFVDVRLRGKGVGKVLVQRFVELARVERAGAVFLEANNSDEVVDEVWEDIGTGRQFRLVPWYEKLGFRCLEGEEPEDSPVMMLVL